MRAHLDQIEARKLEDDGLHRRLLDLLTRYNVNDYAARVRVLPRSRKIKQAGPGECPGGRLAGENRRLDPV
jgi:hypothetical protein